MQGEGVEKSLPMRFAHKEHLVSESLSGKSMALSLSSSVSSSVAHNCVAET